jgi:HSP20 family molecular chaperone IbpA
VDEEGAQAKYENGVLTLTLPKRAGTRTRKLVVT